MGESSTNYPLRLAFSNGQRSERHEDPVTYSDRSVDLARTESRISRSGRHKGQICAILAREALDFAIGTARFLLVAFPPPLATRQTACPDSLLPRGSWFSGHAICNCTPWRAWPRTYRIWGSDRRSKIGNSEAPCSLSGEELRGLFSPAESADGAGNYKRGQQINGRVWPSPLRVGHL